MGKARTLSDTRLLVGIARCGISNDLTYHVPAVCPRLLKALCHRGKA